MFHKPVSYISYCNVCLQYILYVNCYTLHTHKQILLLDYCLASLRAKRWISST
jgi:hypothetical protein